jgi:hypothetical protein
MLDLREGIEELFREASEKGERYWDAELSVETDLRSDNAIAALKTRKAHLGLVDRHLRDLRPRFPDWNMPERRDEKQCINCNQWLPHASFVSVARLRATAQCESCRAKSAARTRKARA